MKHAMKYPLPQENIIKKDARFKSLKYSDFSTITRQTAITETYLSKKIYSAGADLLSKNWKPHRPVRLIGVSLSGFVDKFGMHQLSMFDIGKRHA